MTNLKSRLLHLDSAKGFLIALVILGHSNFPFSRQIYWFHMPAFFIVSGFLFKNTLHVNLYKFIKRKSIQYMLPYFTWGIIFIFINILSYYFLQNEVWKSLTFAQLKDFIFGGVKLVNEFGVFWFIPILLFNHLTYTLLHIKFNSYYIFCLSILPIFFIQHIQNSTFILNLNCLMITSFYFSIGQIWKKNQNHISIYEKYIFIISLLISISLLIWEHTVKVGLFFDIKHLTFSNLLVQIPISLVLSYTSITIWKYLPNIKLLQLIGRHSLTIMYLHLPLKFYLIRYLKYEPTWGILLVLGIIIPITIDYYINKFKLTSLLFIGNTSWNKN